MDEHPSRPRLLADVLYTPYAARYVEVLDDSRVRIGRVFTVQDRMTNVHRYKAVHDTIGEVGWKATLDAAVMLLRTYSA